MSYLSSISIVSYFIDQDTSPFLDIWNPPIIFYKSDAYLISYRLSFHNFSGHFPYRLLDPIVLVRYFIDYGRFSAIKQINMSWFLHLFYLSLSFLFLTASSLVPNQISLFAHFLRGHSYIFKFLPIIKSRWSSIFISFKHNFG